MTRPTMVAMRSREAAAPSPLRVGIALTIAAFAAVAFVLALVVWEDPTIIDVMSYIAVPITFGGVGAYLTIRVPANPIGPLLLVATLGFALLVGGGALAWYGVGTGQVTPVTTIAGMLANLSFVPALVIVLVGVPLVFPDGRLLSPRWRWILWVTGISVVVTEAAALFGAPVLLQGQALPNPWYIESAAGWLAIADAFTSFVAVAILAATVASLVLRYRRGDDVLRHQIRWLAAAVSVAVVVWSVSFFGPLVGRSSAEGVGLLALNLIPVAIGIAVVRYRLFEIDRIISRTISYGLVSAMLVATYVAIVLALQGPLGMLFGNQTVTIAASTLIVAALFQPVRRRVQAVVDRRFDRARVDAERTAAAFSDRLRDQVDIDLVVADLTSTAGAAVRPVRAGLWLRDPGSAGGA